MTTKIFADRAQFQPSQRAFYQIYFTKSSPIDLIQTEKNFRKAGGFKKFGLQKKKKKKIFKSDFLNK
jgi:hypothetical protein